MHKNFELSSLLTFFENDQMAVHDYLVVVIDDWKVLMEELKTAVSNQNFQDYRSVIHRMLTPMRLLKMAEMQNILNNGNFRIELSSEPENQIYFEALFAKIEEFLQELKDILPTLENNPNG